MDPEWCPRCGNEALVEHPAPPFGGWCTTVGCGFSVPECSHPREYSKYIAQELGLPWLALSVHAPYAWALIWGGKNIENRGTRFPRRVTGRVWIHASQWTGRDTEWREECDKVKSLAGFVPVDRELDTMRGHILGSVSVDGYTLPNEAGQRSKWWIPGYLAIHVSQPAPLKPTAFARGFLRFWTVPVPVLRQIKEAG